MKIKGFKPNSKYNYRTMLIWSGAFAVIGVAALLFTNASPTTSLSMASSSGTLTTGSQVAITVKVSAGANQITGAQACVSYDATKLSLTSIDTSTSPLHNAIPAGSGDCNPGQAQISRFDTTPASGDFTLGILNFSVIQASTTATLGFDTNKSYIRDNASTDANGNYINILTTATGSTLTLDPITPIPDPITVLSNIRTGDTISGSVNWTANTTGTGITKVEFYIDDALKSTDTATPYSFSSSGILDTLSLNNGNHVIKVVAYNLEGNVSDLAAVTVLNGDTVAPTVPTSLGATAPAYNSVSLTWTASTDNIGVTGYWIIRNGVTISQTGPNTSFTDSTVTANTSYNYLVAAYDAANNSSPTSNAATVVTPNIPDTVPPTAPANLTATAVSSSQINLSWQPSTDNIGVTGYDIFRALGTATATKVATITSTSFGDSGLGASTDYSYYVVAHDGANNLSPRSVAVNAPTNAAATTGSFTGKITNSNGSSVSKGVAYITFNGSRHTYSANRQGIYTGTNIPSGTYSILYSAKFYISQTITVTILPNDLVIRDVTLARR
jgi:fibronectin type 3 domain-containing protein